MKRFGEKLRYLRKREKYSLRKLGEIMEVYHTYISQIEHGSKPSIEFLIKVANIFQVSLDNLMRDELEIEQDAWKGND
jgi:transcriptional regulator with XRE-family HTH domain